MSAGDAGELRDPRPERAEHVEGPERAARAEGGERADGKLAEGGERTAGSKHAVPLAILVGVLAVDILTKLWAVETLVMHRPVEVLGDIFRLTYTHNPGAAFGIHVGEHSRTFFLILGAVALVILYLLYRATPVWDRLRLSAIALVAGGALGNMLDRVRYERGVVDFLDVGIGAHRWPVFNVADMAVTTGALLLLLSFYLEGRAEKRREAEVEGSRKAEGASRPGGESPTPGS